MKKNEFDFSIPQRQSYVAILMIIWKTYKIIIRQIFPIIIVFFIGKSSKSNYGMYSLYFIIGVAIIAMIYSIIAFYRYYFYLEVDKLIVEKGVFGRSKTSIPFERIQTINFEENLAHQVFSVLRMKIDTAGSSKKEFEFDAIGKEMANALREKILEKKAKLQPYTNIPNTDKDTIKEVNISYKSILRLSISDLIKVGITENHFRSFGLILITVFWIYDSLDEAGLDIKDYTGDINPLAYGMIVILSGFLFIVVLSFIISLIRTILNYYGMEFFRSDNGFKLTSGLLTKKDTSALDHKIQMISWSDNLLRKIIGYFELQLKQASSITVNSKTSIKIPGCRQDQIDLVTNALYGKDAFEYIDLEHVDKRFMYRRMLFSSILSSIIIFIGYSINNDIALIGGVFLWIYLMIRSYFRYRKCMFGHNDKMLMVKGGLFGDKIEILPIYKMQNIVTSQSPYQKRKSLANVIVYTAAGNVTIPYVPISKAIKLVNYLLYKTENSKKPWM